MQCDRCGATNAEPTQFCRACGHALDKQQEMPLTGSLPEQPVGNANEHRGLAIDELPTARVPSVANPTGFAPVSQLPFTSEFPLELEQAQAAQEPPDEDTTQMVSPVSLVPASKGIFALPTRPKSIAASMQTGTHTLHAPSMISAPLEQETSTGDVSTREASAPQVVSGPLAEPNTSGTIAQAGQETLLAREQQSAVQNLASAQPQPSEEADATPPFAYWTTYAAPAAQSQQPTQIYQSGSPEATLPYSLVGMYPLETQADATLTYSPVEEQTATYQAEMHPTMQQPGMSGLPIGNLPVSGPLGGPIAQMPGMGSSPMQQGMNMQGPPSGEAWYDYPTQTPPVPERLGNVYPGPLDAGAGHGSGGQNRNGSGTPAHVPMASEASIFLQPLPLWARIVGPLAGAALLVGLIFVYADWATGAIVATLVAITLAILLGIAAGVRISLGMLKESNPHKRLQVINTSLIIGLLLLFSGVSVSQQNNLHMAQGRYLESHQNWSLAITEYQAAGEKSNAALDVARTYNEWGEAQDRQQQYAGAVANFGIVLQNYRGVPDQLSRAQQDSVTAYAGWANQAMQQQDYSEATQRYDTLLAQSFCTAACVALAQPKDATAYYHLGEQTLAQHEYVQAVSAYQTLSKRFPQTPEASQIHAHYAQALWGKGQQELNTTCSDALSIYHSLAKSFADTSQGQQATTALAQPVSVKGHFVQSIPGAPYHPTAYLVQGLFAGIQQSAFPALLAGAPSATIQSNGSFAFTAVPLGKYELIWSSDGALHFYYAFSGQHVLYTAQLGPLCTYNYGDINQAIPT